MTYFQNAVCPVCSQPLNEQDDIVVCPECGAPYHRACYKQAGHCIFEEKHAEGFSYLPEPERADEPESFVLCPRCGKSNPAGAPACGNCGTRLPQPEEITDAATDPASDAAAHTDPVPPPPAYRRSREDATPDTGKFRPANESRLPFGLSRFDDEDEYEEAVRERTQAQLEAAQIKPNDTIDGFSLREWLSYIGPSAPVYLFHFKQMDRSRHGRSFSLSAALFAPLYFVYRKMWGWSALALLGKILYFLPTVLLLLQETGYLTGLSFSIAQLNQFSLYATYIDLALSVFWGMAAHTFYRRRCIREITLIKQEHAQEMQNMGAADSGEEALYRRLARSGGVSMTAATIMGAVFAGFYLFMSFFMMF